MEQISIVLPAEVLGIVREAVQAGEYFSSSEVVQEALTDWKHRRLAQANDFEEIRRSLQLSSRPDAPYADFDEVMDRLEAKYKRLADAAVTAS